MKKRPSLQTQLDEQRKIIDGLISDLNESKTHIEAGRVQIETGRVQIEAGRVQIESSRVQIEAGRSQIEAGRKHSRSIAYTQMLNTFLNIIKYAQMIEPSAKKRRCSKTFQKSADSPPMELFLNVIYPHHTMDSNAKKEYFAQADSLKNQRDRIIHPRHMVELSEEARRFAAMLEEHKASGDALDAREAMFLDVFSKIDDLCANRVGNLR